ncbi:hypothetical protein FA95DRAFT_1614095 [Auriscalpium vulgare]|uniref:Uncharacterized protein n=1 Tax=Auriscalpium vulgare TaxID=40419 RepID=A0ACB8R177_9AGAM|nr:hypothetical protein FA95DRAFT_1614095 [Auriscalpium vulgare]
MRLPIANVRVAGGADGRGEECSTAWGKRREGKKERESVRPLAKTPQPQRVLYPGGALPLPSFS